MASAEVEPPPGDENDDNWLYGDPNSEQVGEKPTEESENKAEEKDAGDEDTVSANEHNLLYVTVLCKFNVEFFILEMSFCI